MPLAGEHGRLSVGAQRANEGGRGIKRCNRVKKRISVFTCNIHTSGAAGCTARASVDPRHVPICVLVSVPPLFRF
jgi:hypothetical protein